MSPELKRIYEDAKQLPPAERAELIERIIESFDADPGDEIQKAWADEAERRLALHKGGDGTALTEKEVFDRIEGNRQK